MVGSERRSQLLRWPNPTISLGTALVRLGAIKIETAAQPGIGVDGYGYGYGYGTPGIDALERFA